MPYELCDLHNAIQIKCSAFIKRHSPASASSVQAAMNKLLERDIITETNKVFSVTDKLFGMWINSSYGNKRCQQLND